MVCVWMAAELCEAGQGNHHTGVWTHHDYSDGQMFLCEIFSQGVTGFQLVSDWAQSDDPDL